MRNEAWIIGSGLAGATCSYEFQRHGVKTVVFEKDDRWGGLTRSSELNGVIYEPGGSHIFHTNDKEAWELVTSLGPYNGYEHSVMTMIRGKEMTWPIQLDEVQAMYGEKVAELLQRYNTFDHHGICLNRRPVWNPNFEEWCLTIMPSEVYEDFVKPYTEKQWGCPASELDAGFAPQRVQVRTNGDKRLFRDNHQGFPDATQGWSYEKQLEALLSGAKIHLHHRMTVANTVQSLHMLEPRSRPAYIVVTAPLDDFAEELLGPLAWRGLTFAHQYIPLDHAQPCMVVNWPGKEFAWIRTHETKWASGQDVRGSVLSTEYTGGPGRFYPVPGKGGAMRELNDRYQEYIRASLARLGPKVTFVGRLATFQYQDQDDVIRDALDGVRGLVDDEALLVL